MIRGVSGKFACAHEILEPRNLGTLQFGWIHEIACPTDSELYVGELLNWRVQKLILEPTR